MILYFIIKSVKCISCRTTYIQYINTTIHMTIHMTSVAKVDYRGAAALKNTIQIRLANPALPLIRLELKFNVASVQSSRAFLHGGDCDLPVRHCCGHRPLPRTR